MSLCCVQNALNASSHSLTVAAMRCAMSEGCFYFQVEFRPCSCHSSTASHQPEELDSLLSVRPFLMGLTELTTTKELLFSKDLFRIFVANNNPRIRFSRQRICKGGQNAHRPFVRAEESTWRQTSRDDIEVTLQDCWLLKSQHLRS